MHRLRCAAAAAVLSSGLAAQAASTQVTVTVQNLTNPGSVAFAPLHVGFGNGSFDAFNLGQVAGSAIVSVAEGGAGGAWQAAFAAAEPLAARGTIGGLLLAGGSASQTFTVDTASQAFFSFAAMVVPSNDFFIGNDSALRLFDASGALTRSSLTIQANQIWDAGSEVFDPLAAAFVGTNSLRTAQNSVVALNFAELAAFDGLTTGAGYVFHSGLTANADVYRINFALAPVPEPQSGALALAGLAAIGLLMRRRRVLP
jgi:hypothetical protein